MNNTKRINNRIAQSIWFDLFGVALVIIGCILSGYLTEMLSDLPLFAHITWAKFIPFGVISMISSIMSLMSTRLTGRLNNVGNWLGIINVIVAGTIDGCLGNKAAWLTYPISFIIYTFALKKWMSMHQNEVTKPLTGVKAVAVMTSITVVTLLFSFITNWMGWGFDKSALTGSQALLFWLLVVIFGLSMTANILNAMKLTVQWQFWGVYNVLQLVKAFVQGNFANIGKYLYYIINAIACHTFWSEAPKTSNNHTLVRA